MTPVQLPEVPAPNKRAFYFCNKCGHMGSEGPRHVKHGTTDEDCGYIAVTDGDSYTAAQLREYATEAVMAEREEWRDLVQRAWRVLEIECPNEPITDELLAALVSTDRAILTPSETNSER